MRRGIILFLLACVIVSACGQRESASSKNKQNKPLGDCLFAAINYYATGGDNFKDEGCNVSTKIFNGVCVQKSLYTFGFNQNMPGEKCVSIVVEDVFNNFNRSITATFPASWLTTDKEKLSILLEEFNYLLVCLEPPSDDEKSKSPLLKEEDEIRRKHCNSYFLKVNDIPGTGIESNKAPHLLFEALRRVI